MTAALESGLDTRRLMIAMLGAPVAWAVHLAGSYFLVALQCGTGWGGAKPAVLLVTAVCIGAAARAGWLAWAEWKEARPAAPELDPPNVRRFVGAVGATMAGLFGYAILISGIAPLFLPMCS